MGKVKGRLITQQRLTMTMVVEQAALDDLELLFVDTVQSAFGLASGTAAVGKNLPDFAKTLAGFRDDIQDGSSVLDVSSMLDQAQLVPVSVGQVVLLSPSCFFASNVRAIHQVTVANLVEVKLHRRQGWKSPGQHRLLATG